MDALFRCLFSLIKSLKNKDKLWSRIIKKCTHKSASKRIPIMRAGIIIWQERTGAVVPSCSAEKSLIKSPWKCATRTRKVTRMGCMLGLRILVIFFKT